MDIRYGDFSGTCQVCYSDKGQFGTLIDRVGHLWLICQDCINSLWQDRQAFNQPELITREQAVDEVLGTLRDKLLDG